MATKSNSLVMLLLLLVFQEMIIMRGEATECQARSSLFQGICFSDSNCGTICEKEGFLFGHCKFFRCVCIKDCNSGGGGGGGGSDGGSPGDGGAPGGGGDGDAPGDGGAPGGGDDGGAPGGGDDGGAPGGGDDGGAPGGGAPEGGDGVTPGDCAQGGGEDPPVSEGATDRCFGSKVTDRRLLLK